MLVYKFTIINAKKKNHVFLYDEICHRLIVKKYLFYLTENDRFQYFISLIF